MLRPFLRAIVAVAGIATLSAMSGCGWGGYVLDAEPIQTHVEAGYTTGTVVAEIGYEMAKNFDVVITATPPSGFTCNPSCTITTRDKANFYFDTDTSLKAGTYTVSFQGLGDGWVRHATAQVVVGPWDGVTIPPDFQLSVTPVFEVYYDIEGKKGPVTFATIPYEVSAVRFNHYTGPIDITSQLPRSFRCQPCTETMTGTLLPTPLVVSVTSGEGTFTPMFTGTVGTVVRTTSAQVLVYPQQVAPPRPPGPGGSG